MSYIINSLGKNESLLSLFDLHWWAWLRVIILGFIGIVLAPVGIGILFILMSAYIALRNKTEERGITDRRVILKKGIISRITEEMKLSAIETVSIRQGIIGRLLGFGSVRVTGRGLSDIVFSVVADPMSVKRKIEDYSHN